VEYAAIVRQVDRENQIAEQARTLAAKAQDKIDQERRRNASRTMASWRWSGALFCGMCLSIFLTSRSHRPYFYFMESFAFFIWGAIPGFFIGGFLCSILGPRRK
jgi:hypothetical protein